MSSFDPRFMALATLAMAMLLMLIITGFVALIFFASRKDSGINQQRDTLWKFAQHVSAITSGRVHGLASAVCAGMTWEEANDYCDQIKASPNSGFLNCDWISVKDRLPSVGGKRYPVLLGGSIEYFCCYTAGGWKHAPWDYGKQNVTHWFDALPPAPGR